MELAPFGKAAETGLRRRRAGLGKMPKFFFRSLQSESLSSRESFLGSAWVSPDRSCECVVAGLSPMRQNGRDEAGSGLLLGSDGGRKTCSISAGRARVHGRGSTRSVVRSVRCLLQSHSGK